MARGEAGDACETQLAAAPIVKAFDHDMCERRPSRSVGLKLRDRTHPRTLTVLAGAARRHVPSSKARRSAPFSGGKLPSSIVPIALAAALLSTIAVQPAGNGRLETSREVEELRCKAPCRSMGNASASAHAGVCGGEDRHLAEALPWDGPQDDALEEHGVHRAESLLLNPDFVALLVRTAFILLEFGSRPLKNAKKMLSCGLICYWLFQYRFGSDGSIIANRCSALPCPALPCPTLPCLASRAAWRLPWCVSPPDG